MQSQNQALLKEMGEIIVESTVSVLPMLVPKPVEVGLSNITLWKPQAYPIPTALVTTKYTNGPKGSQYFLLTAKTASVIVDLMTGGEGSQDRALDKTGKDALKEMMNQLLSVAATALRDRHGSKLSFDQVDVHTLESGVDLDLLLGDEEIYRIDVNIKVADAGNDTFTTFVPLETVTSLQKTFSGGLKAAVGRPATQGSPAPMASVGAGAQGMMAEPEVGGNVNLILDLELPIVIRLGSAEMTLQEVMRLAAGSIIELNKTVDEPVELLVNNRVIARGEVVVVEGNFAFRVTEIQSKSARIKSLA